MFTALALAILMSGVVVAYVAWAWSWVAAGTPLWQIVLGAGLLYVLIPLVATVLWFTLAAWFGSPLPPEARLTPKQRAALFWNEMRAIANSGPRMVFYPWLMRDPAPAPAPSAVLLLHGVLCNAGVWAGLKRRLEQRLHAPVYSLSYGPPLASIEAFADQVAAKIEAILAATGARTIAIISHSMGGLVARAYLRRFGGAKVHLLITIGTPHHGSFHAYLFPGTSLAQLRPGNAWLAELNASEGQPPPCRIVALWSRHDSMVAPQASARLAGAEEITLTGIGHNALLADASVYAAIERELIASGFTIGDKKPATGSTAA